MKPMLVTNIVFVVMAVIVLVIAVVFLIGRDCVDYHLVNSANGEVAFAWHVDNHAEHDPGKKKIYIDRSVAWQLSPGETSMFIAGLDCDAFPGGWRRLCGKRPQTKGASRKKRDQESSTED